jgi:hypothetical protein
MMGRAWRGRVVRIFLRELGIASQKEEGELEDLTLEGSMEHWSISRD